MRPMKMFDRRISTTLPLIAIAAAWLLFAPAVRAQDEGAMGDDATTTNTQATPRMAPTSFSNLLSGKNVPLKLKMKNLNNSFRRITAAGQSDIWSIQIQMMSAQSGIEYGVYYTQGQTVSLGSETYLIAYRPLNTVPPDWNNFGHGNGPVEPQKPGPNTTLSLSLLNLRTAGSLNDVRTFDPKLDISSVGEINAAAVRQLTNLGQGVLTFTRQRGGALPKLTTVVSAATRRGFYPYVHDQRLWVHPVTEEPFRANTKLSQVRLSNVKNAAQVALFYEGVPAPDGTRAVLFADNHVVRVAPEQWTRIIAVAPIIKAPNTAQTTAKVKSALLNARRLVGSKIDVSSSNTTVALRGTVQSESQKYMAENVARNAAPGFQISNQLRVVASRRAAAARGY